MDASSRGSLAMMRILHKQPGEPVFRDYLEVRRHARLCPVAAYNLGNSLRSPRLRHLLFRRCVALALVRLESQNVKSQPLGPDFDETPHLHDIVSRALTNIACEMANDGDPASATPLFAMAIGMYRWNSVAHHGYGNMGLWHHASTGLDPLVGLAHWKEALRQGLAVGAMGTIDTGFIATFIDTIEDLVEREGEEVARRWILEQYNPAASEKRVHGRASIFRSGHLVPPMILSPGIGRPSASLQAALLDGDPLGLMGLDLPERVAFAASFLANLARPEPVEALEALLSRALETIGTVEIIRPLIAEHEWAQKHPYGSLDHLWTRQQEQRFCALVMRAMHGWEEGLSRDGMRVAGLPEHDRVAAFLLLLDPGFRQTVSSMALEHHRAFGALAFHYAPPSAIGNARRSAQCTG